MRNNPIKISTPSVSSKDYNSILSLSTLESIPPNTTENTIITITLPIVKEHKITIEGIPDLNNDGVIDIKDVLIAIKQLIEREESESS